jgi:MFS family permease
MVLAFFSLGTGFGIWGGAAPTVAARASMGPDLMGLAYSVFVIIYLAGMSGSGLIARFVSIRSMLVATIPATGVVLALLLLSSSPFGLFVGIALFGLMAGMVDLAINAEGTAVEADLSRPVLAGFHGAASLGVALAAILGSFLAVNFGPWSAAIATLALFSIGLSAVLSGSPDRGRLPSTPAGAARPRPTPVLLILGLVVGVSVAGEMAAALFSTPFLTVQAPEKAAIAGMGATAFALCQAIVRFQADRLRARLGDPSLLAGSLVIAGLGFGVVAFSTGFWMSALGFGLIGVGTGCVVPCGFALAVARSPLAASSALAVVALVSAVPRVPTPYAFGEIASLVSYGAAFGAYAILFAIALFLTASLLRRGPS